MAVSELLLENIDLFKVFVKSDPKLYKSLLLSSVFKKTLRVCLKEIFYNISQLNIELAEADRTVLAPFHGKIERIGKGTTIEYLIQNRKLVQQVLTIILRYIKLPKVEKKKTNPSSETVASGE